MRKGAALLDERLVNDPLHWLRENSKYRNVLDPFEKGLKHLMEGKKAPERYSDVITDMYEALEGMAKTVTGRETRDLSGNKEMFISKLKLPDAYRTLLGDYIEFANDYRHALESGQKRATPSEKDTEAFVYLTGLFIRLAIQSRKG